jgi:histidine triad (HIT) family protein
MAYHDWYCEDVLSGHIHVDVVWQDENVLAFHHPQPTAEIHVVIIPKTHIQSILEPAALEPVLLVSMVDAVQNVARALELNITGFRLSTNTGAPGVTPHMHWHLVGPGIPALLE